MSIIRRDKSSIKGLKIKLAELENGLQELIDSDRLTEEDRELLNLLTATLPVDLDEVVTRTRLADNISDLKSDEEAASVNAIREYVLGALQMSGPLCVNETLVVLDNHITLNHRPHPNINGIMNFGMVRFEDGGQSFDLPLSSTDDPYRFSINPKGQSINGKDVMVQYLHYLDPREINEAIGQLILDGLLLIEAED